jgi:riboflavin synthase
MFTGIIQAIGTVIDVAPRIGRDGARSQRLQVDLGPLAEGLALGASVAVQGACLTASEQRGNVVGFDVVPETWERTTLRQLGRGARVHLERSLGVGDPLDGHFVQGHVDGTGVIASVERGGGEWQLHIETTPDLMPYIVPKGSIAIDGTSLTLVAVRENTFSVALVPTTLERTTFADRQLGSPVNIETDILARLVLSRLESLGVTGGQGVTWDKLRAGGFVS